MDAAWSEVMTCQFRPLQYLVPVCLIIDFWRPVPRFLSLLHVAAYKGENMWWIHRFLHAYCIHYTALQGSVNSEDLGIQLSISCFKRREKTVLKNALSPKMWTSRLQQENWPYLGWSTAHVLWTSIGFSSLVKNKEKHVGLVCVCSYVMDSLALKQSWVYETWVGDI